MKRFLMLLVIAATVALSSIPAVAAGPPLPCQPVANGDGTLGCTITIHPATFVFPGPPPCSVQAAGPTVLTGNAIFHITGLQSDPGQFWVTQTIDGSFVAPPPAVGPPLATGHATLWFGFESNQSNLVNLGTIDGTGMDPVGNFGFHLDFQLVTNASGDVVVKDIDMRCS